MSTEFEWIDDAGSIRLRGTIDPDPGGTVQVATKHVSSAQIQDLQNNLVALVAAPGSNKGIVPIFVISQYTAGLAAYDGGTGLVTDGFLGVDETLTDLGMDGTDDVMTVWKASNAVSAAGFPSSLNDAPLNLDLLDDPLTTGDGVLDFTTVYYVVSIL